MGLDQAVTGLRLVAGIGFRHGVAPDAIVALIRRAVAEAACGDALVAIVTAADRADPAYEEGVCCPYCVGETQKHAAAAERQKQIELASQRGLSHLGDAAAELAKQRKAQKRATAEASRERNKTG